MGLYRWWRCLCFKSLRQWWHPWFVVMTPLKTMLLTTCVFSVKTKDNSPTLLRREECMAQVTNWSPCSSTCGVGTSHRINSNNEGCKMKKEIRSCIIRPCLKTKRHRRQKVSFRCQAIDQMLTSWFLWLQKRSFESCQKTWRPKNRNRIEISGCSSTRMYRPRYCRSCPGMCCRPKVSKTLPIGFRCPPRTQNSNPFTFTKNMMWIKKCECVPGPCQSNLPLRVGRIMGDDVATQWVTSSTLEVATWVFFQNLKVKILDVFLLKKFFCEKFFFFFSIS